VGLAAFVYHKPAGFTVWTIYHAQTAIALNPKFN
jgi:hypothetical protein